MTETLSDKIEFVEDYQIVPIEQTHIATREAIVRVSDLKRLIKKLKEELTDDNYLKEENYKFDGIGEFAQFKIKEIFGEKLTGK